MEVVELFQRMSQDFKKVKDESYDPPHSTVNFGRMQQGAGGVTLQFDLRLLPDLSRGVHRATHHGRDESNRRALSELECRNVAGANESGPRHEG